MSHRLRILFLLGTLAPATAGAWGTRGHEMTAKFGAEIAGEKTLAHCHISAAQLEEHVTDPDLKWRRDYRRHPDEAQAHFIHVDKQPPDWKSRTEAADRSQGYLAYRIISWMEKAKEDRAAGRWAELQEHLFGLAHYLGDLTMPLHLSSRHDGGEVGLPDLHAQWESKMVHRYEKELKQMVTGRLKQEKLPALWSKMAYGDLIMTIAQQSAGKVDRLFASARPALTVPRISPRAKKNRRHSENATPRFSKPLLFQNTGDLAADQLTIASRLIGHTLTQICQ